MTDRSAVPKKKAEKRKPMRKHYSGDLSRGFWKRVNTLPDDKVGEAYSLGVVLQNLEEDVLRMIANLEAEVSR